MEAVHQRLVDIVADVADVDRETIGVGTSLQADLGLDFFDMLEVLIHAEEIFEVSLPMDAVESLASSDIGRYDGPESTLDDVKGAIEAALHAPPPPPPPPPPPRQRRFRWRRRWSTR